MGEGHIVWYPDRERERATKNKFKIMSYDKKIVIKNTYDKKRKKFQLHVVPYINSLLSLYNTREQWALTVTWVSETRSTLTSCQRGSYLHINIPITCRLNKNPQLKSSIIIPWNNSSINLLYIGRVEDNIY